MVNCKKTQRWLRRLLCGGRPHRSAQDFFVGSAVLGEFGHPIALEMAGTVHHFLSLNIWISFSGGSRAPVDSPLIVDLSHAVVVQMRCATRELFSGLTSSAGEECSLLAEQQCFSWH